MEFETVAQDGGSGWDEGTADSASLPSGSLSLLQRILLTTDGTVGRILEQYAGEEIEIVKVAQALGRTGCEHRELGLADLETLLTRTVVLRAARTRCHLLYAESLVRADKLRPELLDALLTTDTPIGRLFRQHRLETFREIVASGQQPAGPCGKHFGLPSHAPLVFRRYRIFMGGEPLVLITERFPLRGPLSQPG